jgi:hypothetical protein
MTRMRRAVQREWAPPCRPAYGLVYRGQSDGERGPQPVARAVSDHCAAVKGHQAIHQRQDEAEATGRDPGAVHGGTGKVRHRDPSRVRCSVERVVDLLAVP